MDPHKKKEVISANAAQLCKLLFNSDKAFWWEVRIWKILMLIQKRYKTCCLFLKCRKHYCTFASLNTFSYREMPLLITCLSIVVK